MNEPIGLMIYQRENDSHLFFESKPLIKNTIKFRVSFKIFNNFYTHIFLYLLLYKLSKNTKANQPQRLATKKLIIAKFSVRFHLISIFFSFDFDTVYLKTGART
jgi:hypothetical protein